MQQDMDAAYQWASGTLGRALEKAVEVEASGRWADNLRTSLGYLAEGVEANILETPAEVAWSTVWLLGLSFRDVPFQTLPAALRIQILRHGVTILEQSGFGALGEQGHNPYTQAAFLVDAAPEEAARLLLRVLLDVNAEAVPPGVLASAAEELCVQVTDWSLFGEGGEWSVELIDQVVESWRQRGLTSALSWYSTVYDLIHPAEDDKLFEGLGESGEGSPELDSFDHAVTGVATVLTAVGRATKMLAKLSRALGSVR